MELKSSCRQDERNLVKDKQSLTLFKSKGWGSHHKFCLLGMNIYFNIHSHHLIIDLACDSAFLSFPILIFLSILFFLCTEKIEA